MAYHTLRYQNLTVSYQDPKALGNKMRDLLDQGVKSCTLTPRGIEYTTGRISLLIGSIGHQHHRDEYPEGVTAEQVNPLIYDRSCMLEVNVEKMHEMLGSDPKPEPPKPKPIHRQWMTPEEYERQKAQNPTLSTSLSL